jgi:hypothetical protein
MTARPAEGIVYVQGAWALSDVRLMVSWFVFYRWLGGRCAVQSSSPNLSLSDWLRPVEAMQAGATESGPNQPKSGATGEIITCRYWRAFGRIA